VKKSNSFLAIATLTVVIVFTGIVTAMAAIEVESAKFDPERPMTGEPVKLIIKLGGEALRAEVTWLVNDTDGGKSDYDGLAPYVELDRKVTAGDKVTATVKPFDAVGATGKEVTKSVTIVNAPPNVKLADQKLADRMYTAKVYATDPEGGAVSYAVAEGPAGLAIDQNGNVTWRINDGVSGNFPVRISVKDEQGAEAILQYNIGLKWQGGGR
jgi:hypothetical protein